MSDDSHLLIYVSMIFSFFCSFVAVWVNNAFGSAQCDGVVLRLL
jgi:hypothetical protein